MRQNLLNPKNIQTIPLSVPHVDGNEWTYVKDCLDSGWVSSAGHYVTKFEEAIARYTGTPHAVATSSGTAALHIALALSGVQTSDEVIVPTLTFIAPINAVRYLNANPIFMDCDLHLNIDPVKTADFLEKECFFNGVRLKNNKTGATIRGIILVHTLGNPVNIKPFLDLSKKYRLTLIEDAAESLGSFYSTDNLKGKQTGSVGHFGCFSFNGNKIITSGGGGMIAVQSKDIADEAKYLTTQAKDDAELFLHHHVGFNYRLTNLEAAVGLAQLEQLDNYLQMKRRNYALYKNLLDSIDGITLISEPDYAHSNQWLHTIKIDIKKFGCSATDLGQELHKSRIETRPLWFPNHLQRPYQNCQSYKIENAIKFHSQCLSLPSSVSLNENQIKYVCDVIKQAAK